MVQKLSFLSFFLLLFVQKIYGNSIFKCFANDLNLSTLKCVFNFSDLTSTKNLDKLLPQTVNEVKFYDSNIHTLTRDVCESYPRIEVLNATRIGLNSIDKNAFESCTELEILDLSHNRIRMLPFGLFDSNQALTEVYLDDNYLSFVNVHLFRNTPDLRILDVSDNLLSDLDIKALFDLIPEPLNVFVKKNHFQCYNPSNKFALYVKSINSEDFRDCWEQLLTTPSFIPTTRSTTTTRRTTTTTTTTKRTTTTPKRTTTTTTPTTPILTTSTIDYKKYQSSPSPNITELDKNTSSSNIIIIVLSVISLLLVVILIFCGVWLFMKYRTNPETRSNESIEMPEIPPRPIGFSNQTPSPRDMTYYDTDYVENWHNQTRGLHVPVARDDPYYVYIPGFLDNPHNYENHQLKKNRMTEVETEKENGGKNMSFEQKRKLFSVWSQKP